MNSELKFIEETHEYYLGDKKLPCVSDVLEPLVDFSMIPAKVLERKRQFGTDVHLMIKYYLLDDLDESTLNDDLMGCLNAFKKWDKNHGWSREDIKVEQSQYHPRLGYAGTPDWDSPRAVIDIKTRNPEPLNDGIQLSAYKNFGDPKRPGYILSLFPDGTYIFRKISEGQNWNIFRKLLKHHKDIIEFNEFIHKLKNQK